MAGLESVPGLFGDPSALSMVGTRDGVPLSPLSILPVKGGVLKDGKRKTSFRPNSSRLLINLPPEVLLILISGCGRIERGTATPQPRGAGASCPRRLRSLSLSSPRLPPPFPLLPGRCAGPPASPVVVARGLRRGGRDAFGHGGRKKKTTREEGRGAVPTPHPAVTLAASLLRLHPAPNPQTAPREGPRRGARKRGAVPSAAGVNNRSPPRPQLCG